MKKEQKRMLAAAMTAVLLFSFAEKNSLLNYQQPLAVSARQVCGIPKTKGLTKEQQTQKDLIRALNAKIGEQTALEQEEQYTDGTKLSPVENAQIVLERMLFQESIKKR